MLSEGLAIARRRKWVFLIPMCLASIGAMAFTFSFPRIYNARTIFDRRESLVLANLGAHYRSPFRSLKLDGAVYVDIKGYRAVEEAVEQLGLDKDLPRDEQGELTEAGRRQKQALVNEISGECKVYLETERETDRAQISVILPSKDPDMAKAMVAKLRDNYIERAQEKIRQVLRETQDYFRQRVDEKRQVVSTLEAELVGFRSQFVGVDPANPESVVNRMGDLRVEKEDLVRRIEELTAEIAMQEEVLDQASPDSSKADNQTKEPKPPKVTNVRVAQRPTRPNPEYAQLEQRVEELKDQIIEKRMTMTNEHPEVRRLHLKVAQIEKEMSRMSPTIEVPRAGKDASSTNVRDDVVDPAELIRRQNLARAEAALAALKRQHAKATKELELVEEQMARYEAEKGQVFEKRDEFLRRQNELESARSELKNELKRHNELEQAINADENELGVIFNTLENAQVSAKPTSPKLSRLFTMSLGFGMAIGLAFVLLLELLDRTFRTPTQVANTLELPVLQSIGEIVVPAMRRRRMAKQLVMHAIAAGLIGLLVFTSGLVYMSLEQPQKFDKIRENPGVLTRQLIGSGP